MTEFDKILSDLEAEARKAQELHLGSLNQALGALKMIEMIREKLNKSETLP